MTKKNPTTDDSTLLESRDIDLEHETYMATVSIYRDDNFRFGPYIITADVVKAGDITQSGSSWTSTGKRKSIESKTKKVLAEATGRAVLNLPDRFSDKKDEDRNVFDKALHSIKDCIRGR